MKLQDQKFLLLGDVTRFAREADIDQQFVTNFDALRVLVGEYVRTAVQPRLYYNLEHGISKTGGQARVLEIQEENNGICSATDVQRRLAMYYPITELTQSPFHEVRLEQVDKYFRTLELLKDGGLYADIANELGVHYMMVSRWCRNLMRPDLVHLARRIPAEEPPPDFSWLPIRIEPEYPSTQTNSLECHS